MIRVLQSFPRSGRQTNPYLTQLVSSLPEDVSILGWSWRAALLGRYDILHVHWPELLFRRTGRIRSYAHRLLFAGLMLRITVTRTAIVRTAHNLLPHERGGPVERWLLRWCDRRTTLWIALNQSTELPPGRPSVVIPHGHYRDWYSGLASPRPVPGRLVYFGIVRTYKGVLDLITVFGEMSEPGLSLRILGRPHPEELRHITERACIDDPRVSAELRFIADDELAREVGESELVVLPYTEMHNSGSLLLALSLDRPVLVPETPVTSALSVEVGPGWVITYRGSLRPKTLAAARASAVRSERSARPDLSAREWPALGVQLRQTYLAALQR